MVIFEETGFYFLPVASGCLQCSGLSIRMIYLPSICACPCACVLVFTIFVGVCVCTSCVCVCTSVCVYAILRLCPLYRSVSVIFEETGLYVVPPVQWLVHHDDMLVNSLQSVCVPVSMFLCTSFLSACLCMYQLCLYYCVCMCHFAFVSLVLQCECLCVSVSRECKLSQCVRRQNSDGVGDLLGVNQ